MEHPKHATYALYSLKDQEFYIGSSSDFDRRSTEHEQGRSKSTAPRRPFVPLLCEYYYSKKDMLRREEYFKTSAGKRTLRLMLQESLSEVKGRSPEACSISSEKVAFSFLFPCNSLII